MAMFMKTVEVQASTQYPIYIGTGLLPKLGEMTAAVTKAKTVVLVTDDIVNDLYASEAEKALKGAGFSTLKFVFPNGEASKNITVYGALLEFLAENHVTRTDCIAALGGGVVGDLAGFAAATYQRGVDFIQIPTTLLACVDSSVGGKTAIDLQAGKNLAGAFYQPKLVLCDYSTLSTLSEQIFSDGMAEVIKYGAIFDKSFLDFLEEKDAKAHLETVIEKCVTFKRDVVHLDETDKGMRGLLNFGHTLGHAIEGCSRFAISHGSAVAIGMVLVSRAAFKSGMTQADCTDTLIRILQKYGLPTETEYAANDLYAHALSDKKRDGGQISLCIPKALGECVLYKISTDALLPFIEQGVTV